MISASYNLSSPLPLLSIFLFQDVMRANPANVQLFLLKLKSEAVVHGCRTFQRSIVPISLATNKTSVVMHADI
jgi:hypothetical protein